MLADAHRLDVHAKLAVRAARHDLASVDAD
jgi:hypothetical protein